MAERRVHVLPDDLANRIAAGEVVERPASVVKELAENSVDAGARHIRIRVEEAGKALISVEDDGSGMPREDALLALERHATSKISSSEDLEKIATLGFRGEALPSIASVSRFLLTTRPGDEPEGTRVEVEAGRLLDARAVGAARGTTVEIRDLFYNVPARRKFLKGDATELRNIVETVTHLALVHPEVGFELRSGNRLLLAVPGEAAIEDRASELVGGDAPGGLHWKHFRGEGRELTFAFAAPHEGRGHRKGLRLFVNGRPVQDRILFRALLEGYRGVLGSDRNPVALLWLRLPADGVDVNVHPAKREVRFRDEGRVFRWVAGCVAEALSRCPWAAGEPLTPSSAPEASAHPSGDAGDGSRFGGPASRHLEGISEALVSYGRRMDGARAEESAWGRPPPSRFYDQAPRRPEAGEPGGRLPEARPEGALLPGRFGRLRFLGAFDATYLLFEDASRRELVLIDQHAAHERLLYETLLGTDGGLVGSQPLLFPVTLECSPAEMAAFDERREDLDLLGFRAEPFGPRSVAVSEVPTGMAVGVAEAVVRDLLNAEELFSSASGIRERREALAARAACAAAVKARAALLPSEAEELLCKMEDLENPGHCPHGRPSILRLSRGELEKMFHRK